MIVGLSSVLPTSIYHGLVHEGVSPTVATSVFHLPPVGTLFAAFLGYDPMKQLLGPAVLAHLPTGRAAVLDGRSFFPNLVAIPFRRGLHTAFDFAIVACVVAAVASWTRGDRYVHVEEHAEAEEGLAGGEPVPEDVVVL